MLFTTENTKGKKVKVVDTMGTVVPCVKAYDTETRVATFFVRAAQDGNISKLVIVGDDQKSHALQVTAELKGSKIIVDGVEY